MLNIALARGGDVPLYRQVVDQIAALIDDGALPPGTRLPPVRELAATLGLTRLTAHSAYTELHARGLIVSHVGRGSFVAERATPSRSDGPAARAPARWQAQGVLADLIRLAEPSDLLSFAQAAPAAETYPARDLASAVRVATEDSSTLGYGPIAGDPALREHVSAVVRERGIIASPDEMLITAGAQQGIDLVLRALTSPDDVVLVEAPTYPGVLEAAARRGQRVVSVPVDGEGIDLAAAEAACAAHYPRLLYTVPAFHNPTGASLGVGRREALLRLARAHDLLIVEDDVYGLLGYDGPTPPALKAADATSGDGRVIYCTSFSKVLSPGLRLGAIIAAPQLLPELADAKHSADLVCSPLLQRALAVYLRRGRFAGHLRRVRTVYRERRDALLAALAQLPAGCEWTRPRGGLNLWLTLPEGIDEREFCSAALARGVALAPGRAFFVTLQPTAHVRLSFGAHPPQRIQQGVAALGELLHEQLGQRSARLARASREASPLV